MSQPNNKYSLFQNWVLAILFKDKGVPRDKENLMIQCCDTALTDLTSEKVDNDLLNLRKDKVIEVINPSDYTPNYRYKITPDGILHVRKFLLKPIIDLVQRDDFLLLLNHIGKNKVTNFISQIRDESRISTTDYDKEKLSTKILNYAVNNIGPLIDFINKILSALSGSR